MLMYVRDLQNVPTLLFAIAGLYDTSACVYFRTSDLEADTSGITVIQSTIGRT
jgi:hypothetical protein